MSDRSSSFEPGPKKHAQKRAHTCPFSRASSSSLELAFVKTASASHSSALGPTVVLFKWPRSIDRSIDGTNTRIHVPRFSFDRPNRSIDPSIWTAIGQTERRPEAKEARHARTRSCSVPHTTTEHTHTGPPIQRRPLEQQGKRRAHTPTHQGGGSSRSGSNRRSCSCSPCSCCSCPQAQWPPLLPPAPLQRPPLRPTAARAAAAATPSVVRDEDGD